LYTILISIAAILAVVLPVGELPFHAIVRNWARVVLAVFGIQVHVHGTERLQRGQHYVYVSNHASMFDIPAVIASIPDAIHIVFKKELTRVPIWGWALAISPYITIDRGNPRGAMASLERAAKKIRTGKSILLFAEGTRTQDGKLQPFKRGAFLLAVKAGIPIVPVTINHTYRIMPKGEWRVNPTDIEMTLEHPIVGSGETGKDVEEHLMANVHQQIAKHYINQ
jgi:1-acyl-sn-glycerol-3-phosphate acyltransferase